MAELRMYCAPYQKRSVSGALGSEIVDVFLTISVNFSPFRSRFWPKEPKTIRKVDRPELLPGGPVVCLGLGDGDGLEVSEDGRGCGGGVRPEAAELCLACNFPLV